MPRHPAQLCRVPPPSDTFKEEMAPIPGISTNLPPSLASTFTGKTLLPRPAPKGHSSIGTSKCFSLLWDYWNKLVAIKVTWNKTTHNWYKVKDAAHSQKYKYLTSLPCSRARISLLAEDLGSRNVWFLLFQNRNALHGERMVLTT